jgi:uncharacterized metal-binding protein YceD (DUF177 family)
MKHNRELEIAHIGLKPGEHHFNFNLGPSFFENFGALDEFRDAQFEVTLVLDKKTNLYYLKFGVTGSLTALCDRCGDDFTLQLWEDFDAIVKIVDADIVAAKNEEDSEVYHMAHSDNFMDVAQILYENLVLSLPIQRVHPDDDNDQSTCNPKALELLSQLEAQVSEPTTEDKNTNNSLAEQLEKLKKKKDAKS